MPDSQKYVLKFYLINIVEDIVVLFALSFEQLLQQKTAIHFIEKAKGIGKASLVTKENRIYIRGEFTRKKC